MNTMFLIENFNIHGRFRTDGALMFYNPSSDVTMIKNLLAK